MARKMGIIAILTISIGILSSANCVARMDTPGKELAVDTVNVINRELETESEGGNCSLKISYPQIEGMSNAAVEEIINAELLNEFISETDVHETENCHPEDRSDMETAYRTGLNGNNILSIMIRHYMVTPGGGSTMLKGFTIDVGNGDIYRYEDLFRPNSDYDLRINELVWGVMEEDEPLFERRMKKTKYEFYLTENELVILDSSMPTMAREIPISLSDIADIINPEGPLHSLTKN
jgi:hypothetical protein